MPVLVPLYTSFPDKARSLDVRSSDRSAGGGASRLPLQRRHPTRSPSASVEPWEKLRALHPHGLQAGGVQPKDVDNRRRDLGGLDRTRDGRRSSSCPPYKSHRRSASR